MAIERKQQQNLVEQALHEIRDGDVAKYETLHILSHRCSGSLELLSDMYDRNPDILRKCSSGLLGMYSDDAFKNRATMELIYNLHDNNYAKFQVLISRAQTMRYGGITLQCMSHIYDIIGGDQFLNFMSTQEYKNILGAYARKGMVTCFIDLILDIRDIDGFSAMEQLMCISGNIRSLKTPEQVSQFRKDNRIPDKVGMHTKVALKTTNMLQSEDDDQEEDVSAVIETVAPLGDGADEMFTSNIES